MTLSPHRQHKIYMAVMMGYGLGSEDPEELEYYKMVKNKIKKDVKKMGIQRTD